MDHGRRPQRHRARRPPHAEGSTLPSAGRARYANLNTATFDNRGVLWFTGQSGIYGRLDPKIGKVRVFRAPRGEGPYGITTTPSGDVYYASLAGSYLGRIDVRTGKATVLAAADPWPGRAPGLVGLARPHLDQRVECRQGRHVRPADEALARVAGSGSEPDDLRGLRRRARQGLAHGLRRQCALAVRPPNGAFHPRAICRARAPRCGSCSVATGEVWGAESGTDKLVVVYTR